MTPSPKQTAPGEATHDPDSCKDSECARCFKRWADAAPTPAPRGEAKSIIRMNAEKDPAYAPYCGRCRGLVRMQKVEPFYWRHECGAEHDERTHAPTPEAAEKQCPPGMVDQLRAGAAIVGTDVAAYWQGAAESLAEMYAAKDAKIISLRAALTEAVDKGFDYAAALEQAASCLRPDSVVAPEIRNVAQALRAKAEAWRKVLTDSEVTNAR